MSISTVTVTWTEQDIGQAPLGGNITFTLNEPVSDSASGIDYRPVPKTYFFTSATGTSGALLANDSASLQPAGSHYTITVAITGQQPYSFASQILAASGASQTLAFLQANAAVPAAQYQAYLPLPTGTPAAGQVPVAQADGNTQTAWGSGGGGGTVDSVTAADASVTVGGTASDPTMETGRLDQIASLHPPTASVAMNGQKLTGLASGSASTDAAAFGQIPTSLPPDGTAGGDLSGSYPDPAVAKVNGLAVGTSPGGTTDFLRADGTWAAPSGGAETAAFLPADPTQTTSTTLVMMGLGSVCAYTPSGSGQVLVNVTGFGYQGGASVNSIGLGPRYGTGTPPANGDAVTGTRFGCTTDPKIRPSATGIGSNGLAFGFTALLDLTPGTPYWLDIAALTTNASEPSALQNISMTIAELSAGGGGGGAVDSVFGRTGAVAAESGDYTATQVGADASGAAATAQANAEAASLPKAGGTMTGWLAPAVAALTFGTTISVNAALGNAFALTLTASTGTLANPTNPVDGQTIRVRVIQDATGGRTLAFGTAYDFGATGAPTLSSAGSKVDILGFEYVASLSKWCYLGAGLGL